MSYTSTNAKKKEKKVQVYAQETPRNIQYTHPVNASNPSTLIEEGNPQRNLQRKGSPLGHHISYLVCQPRH